LLDRKIVFWVDREPTGAFALVDEKEPVIPVAVPIGGGRT
jgi:hypothetical protein